MTQHAPDYRIAVVDRTFDLLEALAEAEGPLGVSELARKTGTTKSGAFRILATLARRGYVAQDEATSRFRLGSRLAYLSRHGLDAIDLRQSARPVLVALHARFNETVNLGVLDGDEVVYIDMIESDQGLRMAAHVGGRDYAHATSLGKAILAFLPPNQREALLTRPLARRTANTITSPDRLREELARVRQTGVAVDQGEAEAGARCLGAPIFDETGAVIAALSISGPESRFGDDRADEIARAVKAAAEDVTTRIGGQSPRQ